MKDLLTKLITLLVIDSSTIKINEVVENSAHNLEISCDSSQIGKLIGKGGHNIRSLRTLLSIKGITQGKQVIIRLTEPIIQNGNGFSLPTSTS